MKVFISGPLTLNIVPDKIKDIIDKTVAKYPDVVFLVGDYRGSDVAVQNYLSEKGYRFIIYYLGSSPRTDTPSAAETIRVNAFNKRGKELYAQKDIAMTRDCDVSITLWDAKSVDSAVNVRRAIENNKTTLVYHMPSDQLYKHISA